MIPESPRNAPVPKPRTRFNCGKQSLDVAAGNNNLNGSGDGPSSSKTLEIDNSQQEPSNESGLTTIYPDLELGLKTPPPKPPRVSPTENPPPRPPPPAGWNLNCITNELSSSTTPPSEMRPSPPTRIAPSPPQKEFRADKPVPPIPPRPLQLHLSNIVPLDTPGSTETTNKTTNGREVSPNLIENPAYMTLQKYREMASSTSNDSGFHSQLRTTDSIDQSSSDMDENDEDRVSRSENNVNMRNEANSLLDSKPLPPVPSTSLRKSFNDYTPPPKRDDYSFTPDSRESIIDAEDKTSVDTLCADLNNQMQDDPPEVEGVAVSFFGFVSIHIGKKEKKRAYARLKNMHLSFHDDEESTEYLCGPFHLIGCQMISRSGDTISIRLNELENQKHLTFTVEDSNDTWSILLSECWLTQYDLLRTNVTGMTTCGTFFLRQGTAAGWQRAAGGLLDRALHYVILDSLDCIYELDMRKIISIKEKVEKDQWYQSTKKKNHRGSFMLVLEGCSLYIECEDEWSTNLWCEVIKEVVNRPAASLEEYRLTGDNVPIIVDKCIRFISVYGMSHEGIYRRNGKISEAKEILSKLNKDAPGVHLKPDTDETVYAVADVLRQFFRRLCSPLISHVIHQELFSIVTNSVDIATKCTEMGQCLQKLSHVHYNTLRKLIIHLYDVSTRSAENRASIENLATVFGASLFHTDAEVGLCFKENSNQTAVIAMLITYYDSIFELTSREELSKVLIEEAEKVKTPQHKAVRADGLLVPIHKWEKENCCFNVKTELAAEEVCRQAMATRGFNASADGKYALFEKIRGGDLSRRLFDSERLSEVVINRWIPWKCHDGYLLFDQDTNAPLSPDNMSSFSGKVKLAEPGAKTFKSVELKIDEGDKVVSYKGDKKNKEWLLDQTIWFTGAESSRKAPYSYNITIVQENSNFVEKYVGFCVSFKAEPDRNNFLNHVHYIQQAARPAPLVHI